VGTVADFDTGMGTWGQIWESGQHVLGVCSTQE